MLFTEIYISSDPVKRGRLQELGVNILDDRNIQRLVSQQTTTRRKRTAVSTSVPSHAAQKRSRTSATQSKAASQRPKRVPRERVRRLITSRPVQVTNRTSAQRTRQQHSTTSSTYVPSISTTGNYLT